MNPMFRSLLALIACLVLVSCTTAPAASPADIQLKDASSSVQPLGHWLRQSKYTVVLFISAKCPCVRAHAERIRHLSDHYAAVGVRFLAVNPEFDTEPAEIAVTSTSNGWSFPILIDRQGKLADRLSAEYASHVTVLDANGRIHYQGGIDSDRKHIHADATPYLANALDDLVAGREPRVARTEALGCVLRRN